MKKIYNRMIYDTETATEMANWWNGYGTGDFHYCSETLYKTPKGNMFLYGQGGAMSKYAVQTGNAKGYGEDIIPMTESEALAWMETRNLNDEIIEHFPEMLEEA